MPDRHYAREFFDLWDEGACPVCNLTYVEDEPDDRRIHLRCHRAVVNVFEPKPYPRIAKLFAKYGRFIPVTMISSLALRRRVFRMGLAFMREFGSTLQYEEEIDLAQAFIIADQAGRSIGTYVVRWQESDAPPRWVLMWIWIAPAFRRQGLLRAAREHAESDSLTSNQRHLSPPALRHSLPSVRTFAQKFATTPRGSLTPRPGVTADRVPIQSTVPECPRGFTIATWRLGLSRFAARAAAWAAPLSENGPRLSPCTETHHSCVSRSSGIRNSPVASAYSSTCCYNISYQACVLKDACHPGDLALISPAVFAPPTPPVAV